MMYPTHVEIACSAGKERPRNPDQDDLTTPLAKKVARDWADMESSKRFLLQAEVEFWHEMLHLNSNHLTEQKENEMRCFLKRALQELNFLEQNASRAVA